MADVVSGGKRPYEPSRTAGADSAGHRAQDPHMGVHDEHGRRAAYGPIHRGAPALRWISRNEAGRRAKRERRRTESWFRRAPFPLYGLPPWWQGESFLGGGRVSCGGREVIHFLSLVHGTLVQGGGPILSVETSVRGRPGGGPLRVFAEELWTGRAGDIVEAWARLRDRWGRSSKRG